MTPATPAGGASTLNYYLDDHLGTTQVELDASGNVTWQGQFTPFGAELPDGSTAMHYKFTGKERDTESGLDYFGARYYASSMGRFMSGDNGEDQDVEDPQSWNLYPYVRNAPLTNSDPDGHDCVVQSRVDDTHETVSSSSGTCDGVKVGSGQSKTYVPGTVDGIKANGSTHIDISSTDDKGTNFVTSAKGAPAFDHPGIDGPANAAIFGRIGNDGMGKIYSFGAQMVLSVVGGLAGAGVGLAFDAFAASGAGEAVTQVLTKAGSAVGNTGMKVASREVAEQAADEWVGEGARPIVDRATGKVVGKISADGTKVARFNNAETRGYINLENRTTGSNMHVRW